MAEANDPLLTSLGRREALGLLGFLALAACGSSAGSAKPSATPTTNPSPGTAPASASTSTSAAASTSTTATTAPVVLGSNTALDAAILTSDASSYNGAWSGAWQTAAGAHAAATGRVSGTITIDAQARTLTAVVEQGGAILGGAALPKFTFVGHVDSFTYDAGTGAFTVHQATPIGNATLTNGDKPGSFRLTMTDIPAHPDVTQVVATGVANRPDAIPADFTISYRDGSTAHGSITFTPGK